MKQRENNARHSKLSVKQASKSRVFLAKVDTSYYREIRIVDLTFAAPVKLSPHLENRSKAAKR